MLASDLYKKKITKRKSIKILQFEKTDIAYRYEILNVKLIGT